MNDYSGSVPDIADRGRGGAIAPLGQNLQVSQGPTMFDVDSLEGDTGGFNLRDVWRVLYRWRWLIAAVTLVSVLAAFGLSLLTTPLYRAYSSLEITQPQSELIARANTEPVVQRDPAFLATQYGLLKSRSLTERVVRQLNLANDPSIAPSRLSLEQRERIAGNVVQANYLVNPVLGSRLINLSYVDKDPVRAARIVNTFGDAFIASQLERKFGQTAYARQFLQTRLDATKKTLEASEAAVVNYAQSQGLVMVNSGGGGGSGDGSGGGGSGGGSGATSLEGGSMVAINGALSQATSDRIAAAARCHQGQSGSEIQRDGAMQTMRSRRAELQADYDQKLTLYKPEFPAMVQLRAQIAAIDNQLRQQGGNISSGVCSDYNAALSRESALKARVGQLKGDVLNVQERSIKYNILQREVDTNRALYDALLQRFKEIGVAGGVGATTVAVVDRADVPGAPFQPNLFKNVFLAVILGLGLGVALAYLIEFIDDTVKAPEDVKQKLRVPVLGVVPIVAKGETIADQLADPQSPVSEAYFSISAAIQFSTSGGSPKSLLVSSSQPAEGKSSTCYAIAQNFARLDRTVLLIDADMRKPSFFIEDSEKAKTVGLSALLTSDSSLVSHVSATRSPNLFLLSSGRVPPNPAELLASVRMRAILEEAMSRFDMVIIDAPPVLGLADAPLLASMVQGTLLVVQSGAIRRPAVSNTINRLRSTGGHIIGAVLTKFDPKTSAYGYGRDAYKYGVTAGDDGGTRRIQLS